MARVLVKLVVNAASWVDIMRRVMRAGQGDRVTERGELTINMDEVAIVPESEVEAKGLLRLLAAVEGGRSPISDAPPPTPVTLTEDIRMALAPLVAIADAYDNNDLDDEARKFYYPNGVEVATGREPQQVELYTGRGGKRLLTLADCLFARRVVRGK